MDADSLVQITKGSEDDANRTLASFNSEHAKSFAFPDMIRENKQKLMDGLLFRLNGQSSSHTLVTCLETLRIISREKDGLDVVATDVVMKTLVRLAGLECSNGEPNCNATQDAATQVIVEAQKCLCNIIFNSSAAQKICSTNGCIEGIVQRLKTYKDPQVIQDVKFFDMRMLFLITALCSETRPRIQHELHGFTYLIEILDLSLQNAEETGKALPDADVDLCCEVLKILFNITLQLDKNNLDEEEEAHFMRLVSILHDLLVCKTAQKDKKHELISHTVNLLTNMPRESYEELLTPLTESPGGAEAESKDIEYDGKNMEAVLVLLDFLHRRLDVPKQGLKEGLCPILHCMCEICRSNRSIRKFCRLKVLPYLRDEVKRLPEEGLSIRNKLCKLFTNPVVEVKHLSAHFLFILCKENAQRMVKYTGFGNAAGLLAERGLMLGGRSAEYSSSSEDSDTEEYSDLQGNVNPVTGRWELPKANPMDGMTEEQKEREAMELMDKLHKLQQGGIIQPMKIGADGKPQPISHVLDLVQGEEGHDPEQGQGDSSTGNTED